MDDEPTAPNHPRFDDSDLASLGEKLAALELTEGERAAFAALLDPDEVKGFDGRLHAGILGTLGLRANHGRFSAPATGNLRDDRVARSTRPFRDHADKF